MPGFLDWLDWELLARLEQLVWRFFDRLANIDWLTWPDEKIVGLVVVILIFACVGLYLLSRLFWALQWVLVTALVLAVLIGIGLTLREVSPETQWGIALVVGLALAFLLSWRVLGQEGRTAIRFRITERIAGREAALMVFGLKEPEEVAPE